MDITTHEVFNQPVPLAGYNLFETNRPLRDALKFNAPQLQLAPLAHLGGVVGSVEMQTHARLANTNPPVLHTHDRFGRRIDEVEFHPSYHALMKEAVGAGLHGTPWTGESASPHVQRAAGFMLFTELEPSILCPISMSYAVTPALRGNAAIHADWGPKLASHWYDPVLKSALDKPGVTMGMGMTEKQGGSDVRANTTRAVRVAGDDWGERYEITGHKWFFSAPMCDAFLVLAQAPAGLSCFFMPRVLPDWMGEDVRNGIRIQRLKDKLGNKANASSEVEFHGASAWLVGEEGPRHAADPRDGHDDAARLRARHQRPDAPGLEPRPASHGAAQGLRQAADRTAADEERAGRPGAGKRSRHRAGHPPRARLRSPAGRARGPDGAPAHAGGQVLDLQARQPLRAGKPWNAWAATATWKRAAKGVMARVYREMPLNSIWEGAGNIMALDLLRGLRKGDAVAALAHELAPARGVDAALDRLADALPARIEAMATEAEARRLAQDVALAVQGALLVQSAPQAVAGAFCASRLGGDWGHAFGTLGAGTDFDSIIVRARPQ
jgi:putative acyl-CoA dehydrogenase